MNHGLKSVSQLYYDAQYLYNSVANGNATDVIRLINEAIENLRENWQGADAGKQIQNLVLTNNAMIEIKNNLYLICSGLSRVAKNYRKILVDLKIEKEELSLIHCEKQNKLDDYHDNRDTVYINESVNVGIEKIKNAEAALDTFISEVRGSYSNITSNWTDGSGREEMISVFNRFINDLEKYEAELEDISNAVIQALNNYVF